MKKRVIAVFLFLLAIWIIPNVGASTWKFEWSNTIVSIPVGDELSRFKNMPKAKLYLDDKPLDDARITYSQDGDWLFFLKDVNTSVVGEYQVWYKAFENDKYRPGTCTGYKALIKFIVKDEVPPVIEVCKKSISITRGTDFDIKSNIIVNDNYCKEVNITYSTDFNKDRVGTYDVNIKAEDGANASYESYVIEVIDNSYPEITYLGSSYGINVSLRSSIDLRAYFKAYDKIDGDISSLISFPIIDTNVLGKREYLLNVKNKAGNESIYAFIVNVIDDTPPDIRIINPNVILDYKTDLSTIDLRKYISIVDNQPIDYSELTIVSPLVNEVGTYTIEYKYTDGYFEAINSLEIKMISKTKPIIEVIPMTIEVGEDIDIESYINVIDESDPNIMESIEIDDTLVDYSNPGTYYASIYVINSSGLSATKRMRIIVRAGSDSSSKDSGYHLYVIIAIAVLVVGLGTVIGVKYFKKKKKTDFESSSL